LTRFNEKEQVAILWHEYYHSRFFPSLRHVFRRVQGRNATWTSEFEADAFSATKNSIDDCLSFLTQLKKLIKSRIIKNLGPRIEERIRRVRKLEKE